MATADVFLFSFYNRSVQEDTIGDHAVGSLRSQTNLFLAVWSQFCYIGGQVSVANYFINFVEETGHTSEFGSNMLAVGQGLYAFNRFLTGFLLMIPAFKPRYVLSVYLSLCFVFAVAAVTTRGDTSIAMLIMVLLFESACFATIFSLGLRGLGRHTKIGGSFLVAAISGGMVFPPATGAVVTYHNAHVAMAIPVMCYVLALVYPIYVNFWNKEMLDNHRATEVGIKPVDEKQLELEAQYGHESRVENAPGAAAVDSKTGPHGAEDSKEIKI